MSELYLDKQELITAQQVIFTQRESECIAQAMMGKNLTQIARALGVGKNTAYFYLASVKNKFALLTQEKL